MGTCICCSGKADKGWDTCHSCDLQHTQEMEQAQEPDVVPCFRCNVAMYQESVDPMENICSDCRNPFAVVPSAPSA